MSVNAATSAPSTASERLTRLIARAVATPDETSERRAEPASTRRAARTPKPVSTSVASTRPAGARDAARGAKAGPDAPYSPYEASRDAYAAAGATSEPVSGTSIGAGASMPAAGVGGWNPQWQATFEQLQLAPADIAHLAQAGYDDAQLTQLAQELMTVEPLDPSSAPQPGVDAGSVASADGPLPQDVMPGGQPGTSAWNDQWEQRFGQAMERMGLSRDEISAQLASVQGQPITEAQLVEAYGQLEQSLGAFDERWRARFDELLGKLDTPAAEREQVMQQLATSGLGEPQLAEAYRQMQESMPADWSDYEDKFSSLGLPDEMLDQYKDSGAPSAALDAEYEKLVELKMEYQQDGRLERLQDADATAAEQWHVMQEGLEGKKFDQTVEQIHSSHVSGWKRVGSFALNLIPGVYAAQYLTGKDWVTGEKIDRSNPLNIVGAVASGFAGFSAARGALSAIKTGGALWQAARGATMVGSTMGGGASNLGAATVGAVNQGRIGATLLNSSKGMFQLKSVLGNVVRVGELGRIGGVVRGYGQGMQLAATAAATSRLADGTKVVDAATRDAALRALQAGGGIDDALTATRTSRGLLQGATISDDAIRAGYNANAYVQKGGIFRFNPFKQDATMVPKTLDGGAGTMWQLGRGVNFARPAGAALGMGTIEAAALGRHGVSASAAANVGETGAHVARWAQDLGVTGGSKFRSLLQLGPQSRAVAGSVRGAQHGAETGYRVASGAASLGRRMGGFVATPLVAGASVGLTGRQLQQPWDWVKDRKEIQAREAAQRQVAEREARELERIYAEQQAAGVQAPAGAQTPAGAQAPADGAPEAQVVGTSPTGGQLVFDPSMNAVIDIGNGDVYDPTTQQLIGNLAQLQGSPAAAASSSPYVTGAAPATA